MSVNGDETAALGAGPGLGLVLPGRAAPAGAGWDWVAQGWALFVRAPLMWILSVVVLVVVMLVVNIVPLLGTLAFQLLQPVITAGFMAGCRSLETGGEFEIEHLTAGFSQRFVPLLIVGALTMLGWLAILLVFMGFVGFSLLAAFATGDPNAIASSLAASAMAILAGTLVAALMAVPLMAAYWFAPALVLLNGMEPVAAMKASFSACLRNVLPFLVYGLVMLAGAVVATIPFGLGYLVWIPLAIASTYAAYRRIFTLP